MGLKVALRDTLFGMVGLAFGVALGIGLSIVVLLVGATYVTRYLNRHTTTVTTAPATTPAPAKPSLTEELLRRQRVAAVQGGELEWLKKRTGIDCGVAVSEPECLPFLSAVSTEDDILARVRELQSGGVKVLVTKRSAYQQLEAEEGKPQPVGEPSADGTMVFLYREATMTEVRQFLFR